MQIAEIFTTTGNFVSSLIAKALIFLTTLNIKVTPTTAKIVTAIILSVFLLIVIKFVNLAQKPLKWFIVILLTFLIVSVGFTFFT